MVELNPDKIRNIQGWEDAPIHICMDADYRGLSFCCKPGYSLTFAFKCKRDEVLHELKHILKRAQNCMLQQANKQRREKEFVVGTWVYLKLQPF